MIVSSRFRLGRFPRNRFRPTRAKFVIGGLFFALLISAETATRALVPATPLENVLSLLQRDPVLIWRNQSNLSVLLPETPVRTGPNGFRAPTNGTVEIPAKTSDVLRVVCMGDSTTFGWGVRNEDSYPSVLGKTLVARLGRPVQTINAGMIGYSSHQGRLMLSREILALTPDIVTIPYVINDIDKFRLYDNDGRPDHEVRPSGRALTVAENALDRSRFFMAFTRGFRAIAYRGETAGGIPMAFYRPQNRRVDIEDYRDNLTAIAKTCRENSVTPVFLAMKVNLPVAEPVAPEARSAAEEHLRAAERWIDEKRLDDAGRELDAAEAIDATFCEIFYQRGVAARHAGNAKAAAASFDQTMNCEAYRCGRDALEYNAVMGQVAAAEGVRFIDIPAAFAGAPGVEYFRMLERDPIHPNEAGHRLIAGQLADVVERIVNAPPPAP